ncbi:MAG: oligopeptide:H+ symporter [Planctomycetota bacterium]|nr:oligopeptide:H+ symporter [Planctomycetota bacterium]
MSAAATSPAASQPAPGSGPEMFGHPTGLFTLFFAEMWERFSYYGMRALLVFYMIKGFLGYGDTEAYSVYGAYTALVYATPFIGGLLADKLLGARKAVVLGGLLMAAGHLLMAVENEYAFFVALALLICGNGFFKPNISTMVGQLYPKGSGKRDAGFTIFYIGINLGAALAPLLCGYVGETYGWHYGFGLATIGMLIGVAIFVAPTVVTQGLIVVGALATAGSMVVVQWNDPLMLAIYSPVGLALLVAAGAATAALGKGGLPKHVGRLPAPAAGSAPRLSFGFAQLLVYAGVIVAVPILAFLVSRNTLAGYALSGFGILALGMILFEALRSPKIERERLFVVLILMFFSMLFWAFFEQAGSSVNNFTDRNVNRVVDAETFTPGQVGTTVEVPANQALVGLKRPDGSTVVLTEIDGLVEAYRKENEDAFLRGERPTVSWQVLPEHVGKQYGGQEVKASIFQAVNPVGIMIFGLIFSALWGLMGRLKLEPNTAVKFALGLAQLGLGFIAFWYGASNASDRGMTSMMFLALGYVLHTTGELCLSPVGLSMVTRLSPARMVSTVMGGWFLATAFSNYLAGAIASLTGVSHGEDGSGALPPPQETVGVYGSVFGQIGIAACVSALIVLALSPLLKKWMHAGADAPEPSTGGH